MLIKNKNRSKSAESLRRKAKGPVKWQPVAFIQRVMSCCIVAGIILFYFKERLRISCQSIGVCLTK